MFEYRRPKSWCPFLICTNYTVSGGFGFIHLIANPCFILILFMEAKQKKLWCLRGMQSQRDGWPMKVRIAQKFLNSTGTECVSSVRTLEHWIIFPTIIGLWTELQTERIRTGASLPCAVCQSGNKDEAFDCFCAMWEGSVFLIWPSKHVISSCFLMQCFVLILLLKSVIRNCLWSGMKQCFGSCFSVNVFAKTMQHVPTDRSWVSMVKTAIVCPSLLIWWIRCAYIPPMHFIISFHQKWLCFIDFGSSSCISYLLRCALSFIEFAELLDSRTLAFLVFDRCVYSGRFSFSIVISIL